MIGGRGRKRRQKLVHVHMNQSFRDFGGDGEKERAVFSSLSLSRELLWDRGDGRERVQKSVHVGLYQRALG